MSNSNGFPLFKTIHANLSTNQMTPARQEYLAVMQDVYVTQSGRYVVIDEKETVDPATGDVWALVKLVDHGPPSP